MMYAAHKAAGGMTSVYRQIGIECERLYSAESSGIPWGFPTKKSPGRVK